MTGSNTFITISLTTLETASWMCLKKVLTASYILRTGAGMSSGESKSMDAYALTAVSSGFMAFNRSSAPARVLTAVCSATVVVVQAL